MYDISAKDKIVIRELKTIVSDLNTLIDNGGKEIGKSSPCFSYFELDFLIKRLQLVCNYGKGVVSL